MFWVEIFDVVSEVAGGVGVGEFLEGLTEDSGGSDHGDDEDVVVVFCELSELGSNVY